MLIFVNVDNDGNILESMVGKSVIPHEPWDFFFYSDETTVDNITKYKVELDGFKPSLVIREGEFIPDPPPKELTEIDILKQETEMNALAIMELAEIVFMEMRR